MEPVLFSSSIKNIKLIQLSPRLFYCIQLSRAGEVLKYTLSPLPVFNASGNYQIAPQLNSMATGESSVFFRKPPIKQSK